MANRIFLLSGDLLFASKIRGVAEAAGWSFGMGGNLPDDDQAIATVVLDLATRSGILPSIVGEVQTKHPDARLIAFGPHVAVDRFQKAKDAGIETVITNGQFSSDPMSFIDAA